MIRIGYLVGTDRDRDIVIDPKANTDLTGANDANRLLELCDREIFKWSRFHLPPSYFRKSGGWDVSRVDILWNMVTDADENRQVLEVVQKFTDQHRLPIIDPAKEILKTRRHHISDRLAGIDNVTMPRTLLIRNPNLDRVIRQTNEADFRWPGILRYSGTHNGQYIGVVKSPNDMARIFGDRRNEYYLTEFVDIRRDDGLYRKTRFFFIGEDVVVRQHLVSDEWNIHGRTSRGLMVSRDDLLDEGRAMLEGQFEALNPITQVALHEIRRRIGLEYFGLDAYVDPDGKLVIFEANATMNFKPDFNNQATQYNRAAVAPAVAALTKLLYAKVESRVTNI